MGERVDARSYHASTTPAAALGDALPSSGGAAVSPTSRGTFHPTQPKENPVKPKPEPKSKPKARNKVVLDKPKMKADPLADVAARLDQAAERLEGTVAKLEQVIRDGGWQHSNAPVVNNPPTEAMTEPQEPAPEPPAEVAPQAAQEGQP